MVYNSVERSLLEAFGLTFVNIDDGDAVPRYIDSGNPKTMEGNRLKLIKYAEQFPREFLEGVKKDLKAGRIEEYNDPNKLYQISGITMPADVKKKLNKDVSKA